MYNYVNSLDIQERLKLSDSFFGGRTGATYLYYKVKENEKINYSDICSLYPSTNKYAKYPVGHPTIITENFKSIHDYFGIAKVCILPPRGLFHPILPYRTGGKLKFSLCRTCADNESDRPCECSVKDRVIIWTLCTPEIQHVVNQGYQILKIYKMYHWEESTMYDSDTGERVCLQNLSIHSKT